MSAKTRGGTGKLMLVVVVSVLVVKVVHQGNTWRSHRPTRKQFEDFEVAGGGGL